MACAMLANEYKVIGILHGDDESYYKLLAKYQEYLSGFVSVSRRIKQKAITSIKKQDILNEIIPCGISIERYKIKPKNNNLVIWLGRIDEFSKRVSDIVGIAKQLGSTSNIQINVYGSGSEYEWLKNEIQKNDLQDMVRLMGWRQTDEIADGLSEAK